MPRTIAKAPHKNTNIEKRRVSRPLKPRDISARPTLKTIHENSIIE